MKLTPIITLLFFISLGCVNSQTEQKQAVEVMGEVPVEVLIKMINTEGNTLASRINTPTGYDRLAVDSTSFAHYLRQLPLKADGSPVLHYNGSTKSRLVHVAVVDMPIGKRDLHQCADAVMRLKAQYHWQRQEYDSIHFNFTNGFRVDYSEWKKGRRVVIEGNKTYWNNRQNPSNTYQDFWKYMELVFSYAGTASLEKELEAVPILDMQIGDVFIQGGFPGHAVIVVDMAENDQGEKLYMLAQSYMPAQEIQILKNLDDPDVSPWYKLSDQEVVSTPEWTFSKSDLKRF